LEKFDGRILLVSNTESALTVANAFQQKKQYVLGNDGNISERITLSCTNFCSLLQLQKFTNNKQSKQGKSLLQEELRPHL
ncbi:hypothetical protein OESDEN_22893, partial [Oesophagostomum dentatum]